MKALAFVTAAHITVLFAADVISTRLKPTLERITMSRITEAQVYFMGKAADALWWHKRSADKAHSKCVALLNRLIDRLASMYLSKAAAINAAPYKEAEKLRDQVDVLTASFIYEDERRLEAHKKEIFALRDKAEACTSPAALGKANYAAAVLHKARAELLARKK